MENWARSARFSLILENPSKSVSATQYTKTPSPVCFGNFTKKKRSQTNLEHFRVSYSPKNMEYDPWVLDSDIFMLRLVPQLHLSSEIDNFSRSFKNHTSFLKALSERRFINVFVRNFQWLEHKNTGLLFMGNYRKKLYHKPSSAIEKGIILGAQQVVP